MEGGEKVMEAKKEKGEAIGGAKDQRVESLGWLTESSVMPKKQKAIGGVGASSIVELRAQLYQTQEDVRRLKQGDPDVEKHRARKKTDIFSKKNSGVDDRASRDKLELKAVQDGSASYAALEKKAELYDKLVRGELPDEEEREKYSVDFLRKGFLVDEGSEMETPSKSISQSAEHPLAASNYDSRAEGFDLGMQWSREGLGSNHSIKELIREVNQETKEAREKALLIKQRRQMNAEKTKEKLRQAFLKKQAEKLKSAAEKEKKAHVV